MVSFTYKSKDFEAEKVHRNDKDGLTFFSMSDFYGNAVTL